MTNTSLLCFSLLTDLLLVLNTMVSKPLNHFKPQCTIIITSPLSSLSSSLSLPQRQRIKLAGANRERNRVMLREAIEIVWYHAQARSKRRKQYEQASQYYLSFGYRVAWWGFTGYCEEIRRRWQVGG